VQICKSIAFFHKLCYDGIDILSILLEQV
jgi:hypothetical protein